MVVSGRTNSTACTLSSPAEAAGPLAGRVALHHV